MRNADAALIVTDFEAAEAAKAAGVPFAIYDPLAWYWPRIPEVCAAADLYICQDFFGVRARLAEAGIANAVVVPPLTPEVTPGERAGIVISLGGLGNPYFTAAKCVDYARAVLAALRRATAGEPGPVTSLTSKAIAESLAGLEIPVAFGLSSGHVTGPNVTLPLGVPARLRCHGDEAHFEVLEASVERHA